MESKAGIIVLENQTNKNLQELIVVFIHIKMCLFALRNIYISCMTPVHHIYLHCSIDFAYTSQFRCIVDHKNALLC